MLNAHQGIAERDLPQELSRKYLKINIWGKYRDTPQSVSVITQERIKDQSMDTINV